MKAQLFLFCLICANCLFSQTRITVPGTRVSLIPPSPNALVIPYFPIVQEEDYEMSVIEFQAEGMGKKFDEIDSATYAGRGIKVYSELEISLGLYQGTLLHVNSDYSTDCLQVFFGDSTFGVTVSTLFRKGDVKRMDEIVKSYKSIKYKFDQKINWSDFMSIKLPAQSSIKLVEEDCTPLRMIFAKNGSHNDSVFSGNTVWLQQFPSSNYKSNEDVLVQMLPAYLSACKIDQVVFEGKGKLANKEVYEFKAYCLFGKKKVFIEAIAYLSKDCATILLAQIIDETEKLEVDNFLKTITFK